MVHYYFIKDCRVFVLKISVNVHLSETGLSLGFKLSYEDLNLEQTCLKTSF